MDTREVLDAYYAAVNRGDWDTWLSLFDPNIVVDEQIAGHLETVAPLAGAIGVMKAGYARFANVPKHIVVNGEEGVVVSHISAANADNVPIDADVANYFQVKNGKIVYMANFHDTVPFKPFIEWVGAHPGL